MLMIAVVIEIAHIAGSASFLVPEVELVRDGVTRRLYDSSPCFAWRFKLCEEGVKASQGGGIFALNRRDAVVNDDGHTVRHRAPLRRRAVKDAVRDIGKFGLIPK